MNVCFLLSAFFCISVFSLDAISSSRSTLFKYIDADGNPILATHPELRFPPDIVRARFKKIIREAAMQSKIDASLIEAVIAIESNWHVNAVSSKGALGLMQLMPETARIWGVRNAFNPTENISGGARYLRHLLNLFDNKISFALAAYHAGENRVIRQGGIPLIPSTQKYVELVMREYKILRPELDLKLKTVID
ncbi:MAG: lytic transglycosylase domain-containing protein [Oligoflexia bacterium]|nr:lytic transglycosylase domain-containing protein [Oligoflexia bacterium]